MSRPVPRGTFHRRCRTCGWSGTYDTAGKANYAKRAHSCRKHQDLVRAAERAADKEAGIDRTPKPCLHKVADHRHGQRATYVLDQCRCRPCARANADTAKWRTRQKAYGRYDKYVPAEPVRAHVRQLMAYGIGLKQITRLTGINGGQMTKIMYGSASRTDKTPNARVLAMTAQRIHAVTPIPVNLAAGARDLHRTNTARTHLRALVALGWSMSELGRRLGVNHVRNAVTLITTDRPMTVGTVDKAEALYAQLCMTVPTPASRFDQAGVTRSRNYAKAHGWRPPLALEDVSGVESDHALDEQAIYRRAHGDRKIRLTHDEAAELVHRWVASGLSLNDCARITGLKPDRFYRLKDQGDVA